MSLRLAARTLTSARTQGVRSITSEAKAPAQLASELPLSLFTPRLPTHLGRLAETAAFAPYQWEDPLKVESTMLTEEEVSIM